MIVNKKIPSEAYVYLEYSFNTNDEERKKDFFFDLKNVTFLGCQNLVTQKVSSSFHMIKLSSWDTRKRRKKIRYTDVMYDKLIYNFYA